MKALKKPLLLLLALLFALSACSGAEYSDATERVPNNWAGYSADELSFRFEAGFTAVPLNDLVETLAYSIGVLGDTNRLTILGHFQSPLRDKGTVDYLTLGGYHLDRVITGQDLEAFMDEINELGTKLSEGQMSAVLLQNARIRLYGSATALTYSLKLVRGEVSCVMQVALVPNGNELYQILYSDFSTGKDNAYLERCLSSLSFPVYVPPEAD